MENLKQCRDCGQEVSTKARTCPNCGAPKPTKASKKGCLWYIGAFFVFVLALGVVSSLFEDDGESPPSSGGSAANYPSSIDSWLTEWSTRQAASTQETCRAEPGCDPDEYAASARPETSFGWDGAQSVQQTEDWARGPRYQVTANGRSVLMYLEEGDVVSVFLNTSDGGRTNLCRDGSCE
jgi:hypothetical protein